LEKAKGLECDSLVFDLEVGVNIDVVMGINSVGRTVFPSTERSRPGAWYVF
jgi:hypothetical protein